MRRFLLFDGKISIGGTDMKTTETRKTVMEYLLSGARARSLTREVLGHHYHQLSRRKRELHAAYQMSVQMKGSAH